MKITQWHPHHLIRILPRRENYILLVWDAVVLSILRAMREARYKDKADTVPTPFLLLTTLEGTGVKNIYRYESKEFIGSYDGCGVEF
ncbi:hypothetical protein [Parabacteroides sp. An277]|uniref:hypothetical protein n=1 Tax=Parabacteroides sp. An277 TaxID=1965619 RepID=UPI001EF68180|nr:hypothetical protein [Parabacteroides sp. An277]